jgi:hypothetical protein
MCAFQEFFARPSGTFLAEGRYVTASSFAGRKPMTFWAAIVALVTGALVYTGELSSTLVGLAEIGGVVAMFTLVCAAEVFSIPKNQTFDKGHAQSES